MPQAVVRLSGGPDRTTPARRRDERAIMAIDRGGSCKNAARDVGSGRLIGMRLPRLSLSLHRNVRAYEFNVARTHEHKLRGRRSAHANRHTRQRVVCLKNVSSSLCQA